MNTDLEENATPDFGDDQSTLQPPPLEGDFIDVSTTDEEAPNVHNQLPSPEEYKANMIVGNGFSNIDDNPQDGDDDDDAHGDQLPNVDEYKANMSFNNKGTASPKKSRTGLYTFLGLFLFTVIVTAIAVPLAAKKEGQGNSSSAASEANTGNGSYGSMTATPNYRPTSPPTFRSPTESPVSKLSRLDQTVRFFTSHGIVDKALLTNLATAEGMATKWIADEDTYEIAVPALKSSGGSYSGSRFVERWALAVFYYSTGGANWKYPLNFMTPVDHCQWLTTFNDPMGNIVRMGVTDCVQDFDGLRVSKIEISNNNLAGEIPWEIRFLVNLETWITPFNINIQTGMAPFLTMADKELTHLELQYCGLKGNIPEELGDLTKLEFLGLSNNFLTGTIPESFFGLTNLQVLGIDDNLFRSPIAPFAKFTNIQKLYIEDNLITGEITEEMISGGWQNMVDLDVSANRLVGPIPPNIWSLPDLEVLDLHSNDFIGQIPAIGSVNNKIVFLGLQNNGLEWRIPESISNLVNLKHLDLSGNKMTIPFPSTMNRLSNLVSLFTGINGFDEHPIPDFLSSMTNLRELSMKQNKITGTIPTFFGLMKDLKVLDLDFNHLEGPIPSELGLLYNLDTLMLNRNYLNGTIPSSFSDMTGLDVLVLDGNNITGTADPICQSNKTMSLKFFSADCDAPGPEVECSCCSVCCNDNNATCNNLEWRVNLDGIWEYDFQRMVYSFSQEILPADAKKDYANVNSNPTGV